MNELRAARRKGRPALGIFVALPSAAEIELLGGLARLGLTFILIDAQHQAFNPETLAGMLRAAGAARLSALVRVGRRDLQLAELVLDLGAAGVVFPNVGSADEARELVSVCRYPPRGRRSIGGLASLLGRDAEDDGDPFCIVQIEDMRAVELLDEISVEGIDGIMSGPVDLAASMGLGASYATFQSVANDVGRVVAEIERGAASHGIARVRHCETAAAARDALDDGCELVTLSSDASLLLGAAARLLEELAAAAR